MAKSAKTETTAAELIEAGLKPERAPERLRRSLLERLSRMRRDEGMTTHEALQALLPATILEPKTLETLVAALLAGNHVLCLGPPGSGKTTLAREIWDLFPKETFVVADDPAHSDPFSLVDPDWARIVPPSPFAKATYGGAAFEEAGHFEPSEIDPKDVRVRKVELREGFGFARVQGSPEVFPDNLTGQINLARLEEIGDPTSPLVMEPGKVLQANRGVLLVDEVGKLPRGTQNVLLQALQEYTVSPAKTRETFPADLVAVTTSNLRDLANITEPLNDRLANVHTPYPSTQEANRRIVDLGLRHLPADVLVPGPYRDAAVHLTMTWRSRMDGGAELSEIGSNRTLLDICRRTQSYAMISGDRFVDPDDFRRGALDAMQGRVRARSDDSFDQNTSLVTTFLDKHWKEAGKRGAEDYWCRFFTAELKEDKQAGVAHVQALRTAMEKHGDDHEALQRLMREGGDAQVRRFAKYVQEQEGVDRADAAFMLPAVFHALDHLGAFSE